MCKMINRYIFSFALDNLGKVQKPTINYKRCVNRGQSKHDCELCQQACPCGAIFLKSKRRLEIDHELCRGCYLCSGICPTQCISHHSAFIKSNDAGEDILGIGCGQNDSGLVKAKVPCVASLPWEFYAYFSYKAPIAILPGDCENCTMNAQTHIDAIKERLKMFWGAEYEQRVLNNTADLTSGISRREFFGLFSKKIQSVKKSMDVVAVNDVSDASQAHVSIFRKLLLGELAEDKAHGWFSLDVRESCWGCHICEKLCPCNAITVAKSGEQWAVSHNAAHCTGCQVCKLACPDQAIGELNARYLRSKNFVTSTPIQVNSCEVCEQNMKSQTDSVCNVCKNKARRINSR